jgi:pSer/pThr/pTyr-binding forkhead associated (FHA) protein
MLYAQGGPARGTTFEIGPAGATFGRAPENSVSLRDEQLSRHHASITWRDGHFWLVDAGSVNGTHVNGQPIADPRPLQTGDVVTMGSSRLVVALDGSPSMERD